MQQFNQLFFERHLIPLIEEITTDMSTGEKNVYLRKILFNENLDPTEEKDFMHDYFTSNVKKAAQKPFSGESDEDKKFHKNFLEEFRKAFNRKNKLSGPAGARNAYLPDDKKQFSGEVSRNIYRLAYQLTLSFEKSRIKELIEKRKAAAQSAEEKNKLEKDLELLENGKLKLIEVNGEEQYVSEEEIKNYEANPAFTNVEVVPMIGVGVGDAAMSKDAGTGPRLTLAGPERTGAPEVQEERPHAGAVQPAGGQKQSRSGAAAAQLFPAQAATFSQLKGDFKASQLASMQVMLEESGLEVTKDLAFDDRTGKIVGEVQDLKGQRLRVSIDPNLGDEATGKDGKHKFVFTFIDGETPDGKSLDGVSFDLSKKDIKKFNQGGRRRSAYEVGLPQIASKLDERTQGQVPPKEKIPTGLPLTRMETELPQIKEGIPGGAKFQMPITVTAEAKMPAVKREKKGVFSEEIIRRSGKEVLQLGKGPEEIKKERLLPMAAKAALPPRVGERKVAPSSERQAGMPPVFPGRIREEAARAPAVGKKGMSPMAKAGLITGGAMTAAASLVPIGAMLKPEKVAFVLHCIGICIS